MPNFRKIGGPPANGPIIKKSAKINPALYSCDNENMKQYKNQENNLISVIFFYLQRPNLDATLMCSTMLWDGQPEDSGDSTIKYTREVSVRVEGSAHLQTAPNPNLRSLREV